jgi:hypothetical protein
MSTQITIVQTSPTPQILGIQTAVDNLPTQQAIRPPNPITHGVGGIEENQQVITIAVLGDSMIDTLGASIPALETALNQYFPGKKFKIINYGVGASNIEYALFRLKNNYQYNNQNHPSLLSLKPDIIVIESFAYNNFGNTQAGIDRQWQALSNITTIIQNELPATKIVLAATIAPNSLSFTNGVKDLHLTNLEKIEKTKTIKIYLQNTVNFATSQKFPLANAFTPSLKNDEGLPELISTTDNLHPSSLGAQFFSDTLAKALFDNHLVEP